MHVNHNHPFLIRPYQHASDCEDVKEICKHVYSGSDYLPRLIGGYSNDPSYLLLSCIASDKVVGVIGSHLMGEMIFIFGLRVKEDQRGKGVAKLLSSELIRRSFAAFQSATCVLTVTIPENDAAISIFGKLLGGSTTPRHLAYSWPPSAIRMQYEELIGWPDKTAGPDQGMMEHWPHVKNLLLADKEAAGLIDKWRPAEEKSVLMDVIASVYSLSSKPFEPELDGWMPGMYETLTVDCDEVSQAMKDQRVWLLGSKSSATQGRAALIVYKSKEARGRTVIGIVASGECEINSALLLVNQRLLIPHFMLFIYSPAIAARDGHQERPLAILRAFESTPGRFVTFGIKKASFFESK